MDGLERFLHLISPIKNIFGLYLLMYIFPLSIPVLTAMSIYEKMFENGELNVSVAIIVGICVLLAFFWTIFFLIYFTNQRNKNPELYQKGFMSDISVKGGNDE